MNCVSVQDELLQGSTQDFAKLQPHLEGCPGCAKIAADARASEEILGRYFDDFSEAAPPNWDAAVATVGAPTGRSRIHAVAVFLAAAAVLTFVLVSQVPTGRASAGLADDDAVALTAVFEDLETRVVDVQGLERAEEDDMIRALLTTKAERMTEAEAAWVTLGANTEPELQVVAQIGLGDLYQSMGDCIHQFQHPSYLDSEQSTVYGYALTDMAMTHWEKAIVAYQLGLSLAEAEGLDADAQALATQLTALEDYLDSLVEAKEAEETAADAAGRLVEAEFIAALEVLAQRIAGCPALEGGESEEMQMVLDQGQMILDEHEYALYPPFLEMAGAYLAAAAEVCD